MKFQKALDATKVYEPFELRTYSSTPKQREVHAMQEAHTSVQEGMAEIARGNPAVQHYGDLIVNEETCDRFLQGSKGNVGHAITKARIKK